MGMKTSKKARKEKISGGTDDSTTDVSLLYAKLNISVKMMQKEMVDKLKRIMEVIKEACIGGRDIPMGKLEEALVMDSVKIRRKKDFGTFIAQKKSIVSLENEGSVRIEFGSI